MQSARIMDTLEESRLCRLCGKKSAINIDIFCEQENYVRKINAVLPILVHEMDPLPKQMCHRCSYKLEEFYNFYTVCEKADLEFKNQLSWMKKGSTEEKMLNPMVKLHRFKIKTESEDNVDTIEPIGNSNNKVLLPKSIELSDSNTNQRLSCEYNSTEDDTKIQKSSNLAKVISKEEFENIISNSSIKGNEFKEPNDSLKKELINRSYNEICIKQNPTVNLGRIPTEIYKQRPTQSIQSDRLLRSRKDSLSVVSVKKLKKYEIINSYYRFQQLKRLKKMEQGESHDNSKKIKQKFPQRKENLANKNLQRTYKTDENLDKNYCETNIHKNKEDCYYSKSKNSHNKDEKSMEFEVKQEFIDEAMESNKDKSKKSSVTNLLENKQLSISLNRLPLSTVLKLEKDYICNVDYPRVKTKRHLTASNSQDQSAKIPMQTTDNSLLTTTKKAFSRNNGHLEQNKRSVKEFKARHKRKLEKAKKKNKRNKVVSQNNVQMELKRYCGDCDKFFLNNELFQLHPCYQQ